MREGQAVSWRGVNRIEHGLLVERQSDGEHWLVHLDNGKYVIVNEKSFIE